MWGCGGRGGELGCAGVVEGAPSSQSEQEFRALCLSLGGEQENP